eukprot:GHUV01036752.1.p1 GENE.GHUV01036752.1~~GHUV01036752.1.p1  ORF type:complete len:117 (-),score=7.37 GHUV01036752.1:912-1262(-)
MAAMIGRSANTGIVLASKHLPINRAIGSTSSYRSRSLRCRCAASASYGLFVVSASPAAAEAVAVSGVDWICIDAQHGAVGYETLNQMLGTTSHTKAKRIVRVGGPQDRFGIQQALE